LVFMFGVLTSNMNNEKQNYLVLFLWLKFQIYNYKEKKITQKYKI